MKKLLVGLALLFSSTAFSYELFTELWWPMPHSFGSSATDEIAGHNIYCMQLGVDNTFVLKAAGVLAPTHSYPLIDLGLAAGNWQCQIKAYSAFGVEESHARALVDFTAIDASGTFYFTRPPMSPAALELR